MTDRAPAAERRVREDHAAVVAAIDRCADEVATGWSSERATDRTAIVGPMRDGLERADVLGRLPAVLADAVDAIGQELAATPVAAPPYVAVTSRGPVLRATTDAGRLVVRFAVFAVVREPTPGYDRRDGIEVVATLE